MSFNDSEKRIIDISYRHGLTHITSCLNCVNTINHIYNIKKDEDVFIMGAGHASLALYVALEQRGLCDAEDMVKKHGTHAHRDPEHGIWCSNGSLGQAESIALGMAIAQPRKTVWLVTSDGACAEGSVYETLRIANKHAPNLETFIVFNGYSAYQEVSFFDLPRGNNVHIESVVMGRYPEWLRGLPGHYLVLNAAQHAELMGDMVYQ